MSVPKCESWALDTQKCYIEQKPVVKRVKELGGILKMERKCLGNFCPANFFPTTFVYDQFWTSWVQRSWKYATTLACGKQQAWARRGNGWDDGYQAWVEDGFKTWRFEVLKPFMRGQLCQCFPKTITLAPTTRQQNGKKMVPVPGTLPSGWGEECTQCPEKITHRGQTVGARLACSTNEMEPPPEKEPAKMQR